MKRLVIVGEAPSMSSNPRRPFDGYSGKKLAEYAGFVGYEELRASARLVNVLKEWPGRGYAGEKGSRFPRELAKAAASRMRFRWDERILLAGKRVARASGLEELPYFRWVPFRDTRRVAVIPHPSGVNGYWNDEANRSRASQFLQRWLNPDMHVADAAMRLSA